jgi:tetratricopeptide (TPR) repeat protein
LVQEKVPFFALSAISSLLTFFAQRSEGAVGSLQRLPIETRLANAIVSYAHYIEKMVWPRNLAVLYPYPDMIPIGQVVLAGIVLVGISVFVFRWARTRPHLVVGWLWYLGTLVPVIGLVQVGSQAMADRYTYVPLIGLFIMVAMGVPDALKEWGHRKIALIVSAGLALSFFITVARLQVYRWQNSIALFEHTLAVTAKNFVIHNNLGTFLEKQGKIQEAAAHYTQALRINPNYAGAHNNLGNVLAKEGKLEEAASHYRQALRIEPNFAEVHYNLGVLLAQQGRHKEATEHFSKGLGVDVPGSLGIGKRKKD